MLIGIDHVVILVTDLDEATQQYKRLGFSVMPGGQHPRHTHNALVPFADGSYLELIAFYETAADGDPAMHRWQKHLATGGGLIDFALASNGLDTDTRAISERGVRYSGPSDGARSRPDGERVAWRSATIEGENPGALPFLIQDVTPRETRVPGGDAARHANGVRGIGSVALAIRNLAAAVGRYNALAGVDEPSGENLKNIDNADGVYYLFGPHRVDLAVPNGPGPLQDDLARRGEGLHELSLLGPDTRDIDPGRAGGARLRIVAG